MSQEFGQTRVSKSFIVGTGAGILNRHRLRPVPRKMSVSRLLQQAHEIPAKRTSSPIREALPASGLWKLRESTGGIVWYSPCTQIRLETCFGNSFNAEGLRNTEEFSPFIPFHPSPRKSRPHYSYHLG